jgi:hypothetical protein
LDKDIKVFLTQTGEAEKLSVTPTCHVEAESEGGWRD